jgi:hypothetical protein
MKKVVNIENCTLLDFFVIVIFIVVVVVNACKHFFFHAKTFCSSHVDKLYNRGSFSGGWSLTQ